MSAKNNHIVILLLLNLFFLQSKDVAKMAKHHKTLEVTLDILGNTALHEKVHQSALALLGQLCTHCFQIVSTLDERITTTALTAHEFRLSQ